MPVAQGSPRSGTFRWFISIVPRRRANDPGISRRALAPEESNRTAGKHMNSRRPQALFHKEIINIRALRFGKSGSTALIPACAFQHSPGAPLSGFVGYAALEHRNEDGATVLNGWFAELCYVSLPLGSIYGRVSRLTRECWRSRAKAKKHPTTSTSVAGADGRSSGSNASPMAADWLACVATGQKSKREANAG